jgi:hypothetical protein
MNIRIELSLDYQAINYEFLIKVKGHFKFSYDMDTEYQGTSYSVMLRLLGSIYLDLVTINNTNTKYTINYSYSILSSMPIARLFNDC